MFDLTPFVNAITTHAWPLLIALILFTLVGVAKQGWFSTWIATKLAGAATLYYTFGLGLVGTMASEVIAGKSWQGALMDGFGAIVVAVTTHQFLIKGIRNGRELFKRTARVAALKAPVVQVGKSS